MTLSKFTIFVFAASLMSACISLSSQKPPLEGMAETETQTFAGRSWQLMSQQHNARIGMWEYTLPNQNLQNWQELVEVTVWTAAGLTARQYVANGVDGLKQSCADFKYDDLKLEDHVVATHMYLDNCGALKFKSESIVYSVQAGAHIYNLRYESKTKITPAEQEKWLQTFATLAAKGLDGVM